MKLSRSWRSSSQLLDRDISKSAPDDAQQMSQRALWHTNGSGSMTPNAVLSLALRHAAADSQQP